MPYVPEHLRGDLDFRLRPLVAIAADLPPGELNYALTRILDASLGNELSYSNLNEKLGVLEAVKLELYRRLAAPYEDRKLEEHGDVYNTRSESNQV